jgi:hypothetical protein
MKSFAKIISAIALASASVSAMAYPIATPSLPLNLDVAGKAPASFVFDLNNINPGYIAGQSTLDSAFLHVSLSDPLGGNEQYLVFFGNATMSKTTVVRPCSTSPWMSWHSRISWPMAKSW